MSHTLISLTGRRIKEPTFIDANYREIIENGKGNKLKKKKR